MFQLTITIFYKGFFNIPLYELNDYLLFKGGSQSVPCTHIFHNWLGKE